MDRKFQIGEIARFFDMPASTLRYWEDKGVLHPGKKSENQYREYTIEDLMTISDVIFYKNLGLQLKEICGMEASTPKQHHELFAEKIVELKRQQETYRTGAIISRFLLCTQENGKTYDFYKTFVEIQ